MRRSIVMAGMFCLLAGSAHAQRFDWRDAYVFYEGNNCTQDLLFTVHAGLSSNSCKGYPSPCYGNNDEARSVLIRFGNLNFDSGVKSYHLTVFDSPEKSRDKDVTYITIRGRPPGNRPTYCLSTFNKSQSLGFMTVDRRRGRTDDGKLDGKISYIETWYNF